MCVCIVFLENEQISLRPPSEAAQPHTLPPRSPASCIDCFSSKMNIVAGAIMRSLSLANDVLFVVQTHESSLFNPPIQITEKFKRSN